MSVNWQRNDYFAMLLRPDKTAHTALEMLVDDLHTEKEKTINKFLCHSGSEDFLWGLAKLLANENSRVAGNSAYIIGTLAESELGCYRVLSLTSGTKNESRKILEDLTKMLAFDDPESVMNAAGTMGTLAESHDGRQWMLGEPCINETIDNITALLINDNLWTASNSALVLARITIAEEGCTKLLEHENAKEIMTKLVLSLGVDEAGRGMNAAFAIGRLCDMDTGRAALLALNESEKMISSLAKMLCCEDPGASKNACFALSCLATSNGGHSRILHNSHSDEVLKTLSDLLAAEDPETGWFAAMTLHTLAAQPKGCLRLRDHHDVLVALLNVEKKSDVNEDLKEEVIATLEILKKLGRPPPPTVEVKGSDEIQVSWEEAETKSGLEVRYQVFDGIKLMWAGKDLKCTLLGLKPYTTYGLRMRACTEGDESPFSDTVQVTTEEDLPGPPENFRVLGATITQLKVGWEPPSSMCGNLKGYYVYVGNKEVDHTHELSSIITGLSGNSNYEVHVCAATSKGKGAKATVSGVTSEVGAHAPSKPNLHVIGRNEIHVSWDAPEVPLGKITKYELNMNGKQIFMGMEMSFTSRRLKPDTEYTFTVSAVTGEGKSESKPSKARTHRDVYDTNRPPLYPATVRKYSIDEQSDKSEVPGKPPTSPKKRGKPGKTEQSSNGEGSKSAMSRASSAGSAKARPLILPEIKETKSDGDLPSGNIDKTAANSNSVKLQYHHNQKQPKSKVQLLAKERPDSGSSNGSGHRRSREDLDRGSSGQSSKSSGSRGSKKGSGDAKSVADDTEKSVTPTKNNTKQSKKLSGQKSLDITDSRERTSKNKNKTIHSDENENTMKKPGVNLNNLAVKEPVDNILLQNSSDSSISTPQEEFIPRHAWRQESRPIKQLASLDVMSPPSSGHRREGRVSSGRVPEEKPKPLEPDPDWMAHAKKYINVDLQRELRDLETHPTMTGLHHHQPMGDVDPLHAQMQRSMTFTDTNRPSHVKKSLEKPRWFNPATSPKASSWSPELPVGVGAKSSDKFVPMQLRTQPSHLPGPGGKLQREMTTIYMRGPSPSARRLDSLGRSRTSVDMKSSGGNIPFSITSQRMASKDGIPSSGSKV